jgi:DNA-binding NarL/FixJ family response regulator
MNCIALGALAYVAKSEGKEHLITAVRAASRGET